MPNHVTNIIELRGDSRQIKEMLQIIKNDDLGAGTIDFNKTIPMPPSLNIEAGSRTDNGLKAYREFVDVYLLGRKENEVDLSAIPPESEQAFLKMRKDIKPDEWALGKAAYHNIRQYGVATWYDWSVNNWGTKWNAYGYEPGTDYSGSDILCFQTAWAAPHPVMEKLAELYPDVEFTHKWADEDIGQNCGSFEYAGGCLVQDYFPEGERERMEFAAEVMDVNLAEYDLYLNARGDKYICVETDSYEAIELLGKPALFTNARITDADIPQGLYCYHLRESDTTGRFVSIERGVGVNHGGSVITNEPVDLGTKGYISFTEDTEPNFLGEDLTIGEYMRGDFPQAGQTGGMQL